MNTNTPAKLSLSTISASSDIPSRLGGISFSSQPKMAQRLVSIAATLSILLVASQLQGGDADTRCYDHQTSDYNSQFKPSECGQQCTVTPFFSPDHSLDVYLELIASAQESIDIFTPGQYIVYWYTQLSC